MNRAFTLIELLVVVTIIVVLLALLTPALDKAIEAAQRAVCASRLHAFGLALPQYAMDNRRKLLKAVIMYDGPYPNFVHNLDAQGPGEWSAERIGPYIGGVDLQRVLYGMQWFCPSNGKTAIKDQGSQAAVASSTNRAFASDYSYFSRVGVDYATRPDDLTDRALGAGKLLMADTLFLWRGQSLDTWWFNHHREGSSVYKPAYGGPIKLRDEIQGITGTNQLFGDGAVVWKHGDLFEKNLMYPPSTGTGFVSHMPGPSLTGDLNFY